MCACALSGLRGIPVAGGGCNTVSDGSLARLAKKVGIVAIGAKGSLYLSLLVMMWWSSALDNGVGWELQ